MDVVCAHSSRRVLRNMERGEYEEILRVVVSAGLFSVDEAEDLRKSFEENDGGKELGQCWR